MLIKIVLIITFFITLLVASWQILKFRNLPNFYLGLFSLFFSVSILYVLGVNFLHKTEYNFLILIPFNLVFFPLYFLMRYVNRFLLIQVFSKNWLQILLFLSFFELSSYLLPLGAWLFTGIYNTDLTAFLFKIKHFFMLILMPLGLYIFVMIRKPLKANFEKKQEDILRFSWLNEFSWLILGLLILIETPVFAYFLKVRHFNWFVLQCVAGAGMVNYMLLKNWILQSQIIEKNKQSQVTEQPELNRHFQQIIAFFEQEKLYRNPDLRIVEIAERLALSPNYVSKIINENAQIGFSDFVNRFRVAEVIEKLENQEHLKKNIFALAQESGFKSKSTFQTVFKKITGKTPTEFLG